MYSKVAEQSMFANKPIVVLGLDVGGILYEVYLNGARVFVGYHGFSTLTAKPVNLYMRSGENVLEVWLFKKPEKAVPSTEWQFPLQGEIHIEVRSLNKGDENATPRTITDIDIDVDASTGQLNWAKSKPRGTFDSTQSLAAADDGDVVIGDVKALPDENCHGQASACMKLQRTFSIPMPLPKWRFFDSEIPVTWGPTASKSECIEAYRELLRAYHELRDLLAAGNREAFIEALRERSEENDLANYDPRGTTEQSVRLWLEHAIEKGGEIPASLETSGPGRVWPMGRSTDGRLAWLSRNRRDSPLIGFPWKDDPSMATGFHIIFRRENGKFIVTR